MNIALLTDAWAPQVNGVVRTWTEVVGRLRAWGHRVLVVHPGLFRRTVGVPKYPEIRLALFPRGRVADLLDEFGPDAIHVATEGPIGMAGRAYCVGSGLPFTTSYHTQFPLYLSIYYKVPPQAAYGCLRWFHGVARHTLVPTPTVATELRANGFGNVRVWSRGVDTDVFHPWADRGQLAHLPGPIFLSVSRVAAEKNLEAFLSLDLPGSKVVVGDGPARAALARRYPDAHWTGYLHGELLSRAYAAADVFVFPSRTDTFGVTMLEANACGVPVAAFPVTGPIDVVKQNVTGVLNLDLQAACLAALRLNRDDCVRYARTQSWEACAQTVLDSLAPLRYALPAWDAADQDSGLVAVDASV